jgi:hypothetical protein
MSYGREMCSSFQRHRRLVKYSAANGDNSIGIYVFCSTTEKALPLRAQLPLADTTVPPPLPRISELIS